jgi:hypothetical protein
MAKVANIDKLVADNERFAAASAYSLGLQHAGMAAAWHTAQYRPLKCAARRMANYDVDASSQGGTELHHVVSALTLHSERGTCGVDGDAHASGHTGKSHRCIQPCSRKAWWVHGQIRRHVLAASQLDPSSLQGSPSGPKASLEKVWGDPILPIFLRLALVVVSSSAGGAKQSVPSYRPREDGLAHPADTSRSNL